MCIFLVTRLPFFFEGGVGWWGGGGLLEKLMPYKSHLHQMQTGYSIPFPQVVNLADFNFRSKGFFTSIMGRDGISIRGGLRLKMASLSMTPSRIINRPKRRKQPVTTRTDKRLIQSTISNFFLIGCKRDSTLCNMINLYPVVTVVTRSVELLSRASFSLSRNGFKS